EDANLDMDADLAMTGFNALVENALENLAEKKKKTYSELGIGIISMRSDFKTIYGDDVHKVISDN
ncbi:MAG: hypothetical protein IJQ27_00900, partial [Spirochaetia bacterium]|nr:hypothetical protein [Spirochaetia bacterium]